MYSETNLSRNETFLGKNRMTEEERVWFYSFQSKWRKLYFTLINIFLPPPTPELFYGKSDWGICIFWDCVVCTSSEGSITRKVRPMWQDIHILWSPLFWNSSDWGICTFWDCVVCTNSEGFFTWKVRPMWQDIRILLSPLFWNSRSAYYGDFIESFKF